MDGDNYGGYKCLSGYMYLSMSNIISLRPYQHDSVVIWLLWLLWFNVPGEQELEENLPRMKAN
jgi:hypothetical protein